LYCNACRRFYSPFQAIREIKGRFIHFTESKDSKRWGKRGKLYIMEADPIIGRGWRLIGGGKRREKVITVKKVGNRILLEMEVDHEVQ